VAQPGIARWRRRANFAAMPIPPELKEILACPRCKGELTYPEAVDEIHCPRCRLAFRVEAGIPVMLLDEARPLA
jgi:uncharacterized protein YbaR (Trm112 family)